MFLLVIAASAGVLPAEESKGGGDKSVPGNTTAVQDPMPVQPRETAGPDSEETPLPESTVPAHSQESFVSGLGQPAAKQDMIPAMPKDTSGFDSSDESMKFPLFRAVGGLGVVLCLMVALYLGARKFFPHYFKKSVSEQNLKILETLPMGDRRSIALIEVAEKRFLIGNTQQQINLLTEIEESVPLASPFQAPSGISKKEEIKESEDSFKNLFEFEKKRPMPNSGNPLPEDIRTKMRMLREALER
jgi:flagellar biosynthetic protein FliO